MANVLVTVSVQDLSGPSPLDGVRVMVYLDDGITYITQGVTGAPFAPGEVQFILLGELSGKEYVLRLVKDGWNFPSGSLQTIVVTDPPAPPNIFGPFDALEGASDLLAEIVVQDETPAPVEGVRVRFYSYPADSFLAEDMTSVAGKTVTPLDGLPAPGKEYIVRLWKDGYLFSPGPSAIIQIQEPLIPPATNIFDFTASLWSATGSADPDMCRITGVLTDVSLRPLQGRTIRFIPIKAYPENDPRFSAHFLGDPTLVRSNILAAEVQTFTDNLGRIDIELPRGGIYDVHLQGFENPAIIAEYIQVPEAPSAAIQDLLWPYVTEVVYDTDPVTLTIGGIAIVGIEVTSSLGSAITGYSSLKNLLEFSLQNTDLGEAVINADGDVSITGKAAGSTILNVARIEGSVAPRRPAVPSIIVTPPVVVVS